MKFAIITSENLVSNQIFQGLLSTLLPNISVVFIVPNVPNTTIKDRKRFWRLLRRPNWRFLLFKFVEIYVSSFLHGFRGTNIHQQCKKNGLRTETYKSADDPTLIKTLDELSVDILLSAGPVILPAPVISSPKIATLNCHCARLPNFKGPANYIWMCLSKVRELYVSIQLMTLVIDEGPVLREQSLIRDEKWSVYELNWRLSKFAGRVYGDYCSEIIKMQKLPNDHPKIDESYATIKNRGFPKRRDFQHLSMTGISLIRLTDLWRYY